MQSTASSPNVKLVLRRGAFVALQQQLMAAYGKLEQADGAEQDVGASESFEIEEVTETGAGSESKSDTSDRDFIRQLIVGYTTCNAVAGLVALFLKLFGATDSKLWLTFSVTWALGNCLPVAFVFVISLAESTYNLASQFI